MSGRLDEFEWIARLRPLTRGDRRALGLMDDAAVLPPRPGYDLVITKDAMVEGVHFLAGEARDVVARRLLRTNLSDLAAKGAEPFGYFLATSWPAGEWDERDAFIAGLAEDGERYGLSLLGGDTTASPGSLTVSATMLGWTPSGAMVTRGGARPGDDLTLCGGMGQGWLGLQAALGRIPDPGGALAAAYRLPEPLLALTPALRTHAHAAADVSDGLLADSLHIADASGCGVEVTLDSQLVCAAGLPWLESQPDRTAALLQLAAGGDDYAVVCAHAPDSPFRAAAEAAGVSWAPAGRMTSGSGLTVLIDGRRVETPHLGWRHA